MVLSIMKSNIISTTIIYLSIGNGLSQHFVIQSPILDALAYGALSFLETRLLVQGFIGNSYNYKDNESFKSQLGNLVAIPVSCIYVAMHYSLYGHRTKIELATSRLGINVRDRGITQGSLFARYPRTSSIVYLPVGVSAVIHAGVLMAATAQVSELLTTGKEAGDISNPIKIIIISLFGLSGFVQGCLTESHGPILLAKGLKLETEQEEEPDDIRYRLGDLLVDSGRVAAIVILRFGLQLAFSPNQDPNDLSEGNRAYSYFFSSGGTVLGWLVFIEVWRLMKKYPETFYEMTRQQGVIEDETDEQSKKALQRYVTRENLNNFYHSWPRLISQGVMQTGIATAIGYFLESVFDRVFDQDGLESHLALNDAQIIASIFSGVASVAASRGTDYLIYHKILQNKYKKNWFLFAQKS